MSDTLITFVITKDKNYRVQWDDGLIAPDSNFTKPDENIWTGTKSMNDNEPAATGVANLLHSRSSFGIKSSFTHANRPVSSPAAVEQRR